ncbi:large ribosomal subunit protein bL35m-like [Liolophura sinensis]|uniref:large ribosomal subunit protein bL35m-like n=1 Tax=Liolophura sinensis TaxID=3198878 RepID=UPI0031586ECF
MAFHLSRLFSGLRVSQVLPCARTNLMATCTLHSTRLQSLKHLKCVNTQPSTCSGISQLTRQLSTLSMSSADTNRSLLQPLMTAINVQRSKVVCSRQNGKPKCVRAVTRRFYRLDWGVWIRPKAGRHKKLWKKNKGRKFRIRQHVFCNKTQSKLLDKMVTAYWRRKRNYVEDPYEPYQLRTNFPLVPDKPKPFYP